MAYKVFIFTLLMITWVVLSGQFDAFHLALGLISCGLVTWMSSDLLFQTREQSVGERVCEGWRLAFYFLWMIWQIFLANIAVLRLALSPDAMKKINPSIVHFKTGLKSDFAKFLLANSITLTPGTVTIKIMGDDFYVHAINDAAAAGLDGEMERRIARIYRSERDARGGNSDGKESA
ncbi:MAG: Na+/H+ antiporter subunit E [Lentisphaeria bacterium]|tara:strand:+ start:970 stop:1500 length:531 start_codon:yes stop_codon:yes gene_type:complete